MIQAILNGIIIGAVGGACAGVSVWAIQLWYTKRLENRDEQRVYNWLHKNTADKDGKRYRSTRAIASHNNLTQDRVRYICSIHTGIELSLGDEEDLWCFTKYSPRKRQKDRGAPSA